jgi:hypothetical protein
MGKVSQPDVRITVPPTGFMGCLNETDGAEPETSREETSDKPKVRGSL